MGRAEASFEHRVQRRLERAGCVVINAARSRPVDLVALPPPPSRPILVEVKARGTRAPEEQAEMQRKLAERAGCTLIRLRQGRIRGHVAVEEVYPPEEAGSLASLLDRAFGRNRWEIPE
jgi:hypothetical protein